MNIINSFDKINLGDLVKIYVKRGEGGSSMGPSVFGKQEYETWVVYNGTIGKFDVSNCYHIDNLEPVGIPISLTDIVDIKSKAGLSYLEKIWRKDARKIGRWALTNYVQFFAGYSFPIVAGEKVYVDNYSKNNSYKVLNKLHGIKNSHKVLMSKELEFISYNAGIVTVKCCITGKTATTWYETLTVK